MNYVPTIIGGMSRRLKWTQLYTPAKRGGKKDNHQMSQVSPSPHSWQNRAAYVSTLVDPHACSNRLTT